MILAARERAVLVGGCAQVAHLRGTYVPKTGQTGQTGQLIENAGEFDAPAGQKPTSRHAKLASGTVRPGDGAPQP